MGRAEYRAGLVGTRPDHPRCGVRRRGAHGHRRARPVHATTRSRTGGCAALRARGQRARALARRPRDPKGPKEAPRGFQGGRREASWGRRTTGPRVARLAPAHPSHLAGALPRGNCMCPEHHWTPKSSATHNTRPRRKARREREAGFAAGFGVRTVVTWAATRIVHPASYCSGLQLQPQTGLRTANCKPQTADRRLQTADC